MSSTSRSDPHRARRAPAPIAWAVALSLALAAPWAARAAPLDGAKAAEIALQAGKAFRAREYEEAARLFLQAYALSARPAQLRNAARAFEEAGRLDEAAEHWARYRDHPGITADERAEADARLKLVAERKRSAEMVKAAEAAKRAAEVASEAAAAARAQVDAVREAEARRAAELTAAEDHGTPAVGYSLIGTGGAMAVVGGVLWAVAAARLGDVDGRLDQRDADGRITGIGPAELGSEVSSINTQRVLSGVLFTAGLVVVAGGVLWLITDGPSEEEPGGPRLPAVREMSRVGGPL